MYTKWFLALCAVLVVCMTTLIALGHNGAITTSFVGIASGLFGLNFWEWLKSRDKV